MVSKSRHVSLKKHLVYLNIMQRQHDSMCHDPAAATHSLRPIEGRLKSVT